MLRFNFNSSRQLFCFFAAISIFSAANLMFAQDETKSAAQEEDGFAQMFDGESLEGWTGNPDLWTVEEGAITGTTTADTGLKYNQFLTWDGGKPADFELRLKFKIQGGNSGVQFRSSAVEGEGDYRVGGYQADIDSKGRYMGILYEERGRGILAERSKQVEITAEGKKTETGTTGDDEEIVAAIEMEDWNEYTIRAEGNHIVQMINGKVVVDLTDNQEEKAATAGIIAFQIHVGPPMKVQFKDVRIKMLDDE